MSISTYFDEKLGCECFRVRVVRKSSAKSGITISKSAHGFKTKTEADKAEKKLILEAQRELFQSESLQAKWKTLIEEWYEAVHRGDIFTRALAKSSQDDYYSALRNHTKEWMEYRVDEISKSMVWLKLDQMERDYTIKSRKRLRTSIDAVFKWALLANRIKVSSIPTEGFQSNRKEEEEIPEILNLEEIRLLLKLARESNNEWYPVWALALYTGMRSGELYALRWSSIDFSNSMIYVHENWTNKNGFGPTKGRYWRAVPISEHMSTFLKELKLKTESTGFVLPRFALWESGAQAQVLRFFCEGNGIPSIKFHTLRSCFATQLIKDGVAPAIVMKMAGWKDLKTMQRYIRLAGIEVKGATDGLKLLPDEVVMGRVINMFDGRRE